MAKARIQARVDDTRKREVEAYVDEHDITQAEAVRRLVGRGIDYERGLLKDRPDGGEAQADRDGGAVSGPARTFVQVQATAGVGLMFAALAFAAFGPVGFAGVTALLAAAVPLGLWGAAFWAVALTTLPERVDERLATGVEGLIGPELIRRTP